MSMSARPSNPDGRVPMRSSAIYEGAERMLALIESEIQAHTAAAQKENAELRAALAKATAASRVDSTVHAQLQQANEHIDRLTIVLAMFGVACRRNGDVVGYDKEWGWLLGALKESEEDSDDEDSKKEGGPVQLQSAFGMANPMQVVARVRRVLERRQAKTKHWKEKYIEMEMDRDEQKKAMAHELDELRRQLEVAQTRSSEVHPPPMSPQQ